MYKFLVNKGQTVALALGLAVIAIFLITVTTGISSAGYDMSTDLNALGDEAKAEIGFFNAGLGLTMFLIVLAALLAFVVFGFANFFKFPKESKRAVFAMLLLFAIFLLFYFIGNTEFADGSKMTELIGKFGITDGVLKFIGGGINLTLLMGALAVVTAIVFEIKNLFN